MIHTDCRHVQYTLLSLILLGLFWLFTQGGAKFDDVNFFFWGGGEGGAIDIKVNHDTL